MKSAVARPQNYAVSLVGWLGDGNWEADVLPLVRTKRDNIPGVQVLALFADLGGSALRLSSSFQTVPREHWERNWQGDVSMDPLGLNTAFARDVDYLVRRGLSSRTAPHIVEIGFAPGKFLHHFETSLGATCSGYDYSTSGCAAADRFLTAQGSAIEIHCQDVTETPPLSDSADCVYSIGVVEHFEDPWPMIQAHLRPLKPTGVALIMMPNYSGLNLRIQRWLDPENIAIHNLSLMQPAYWLQRTDELPGFQLEAGYFGRPSASMFSLQRYGFAGKFLQFGLNKVASVLPRSVAFCNSMIVVTIRRMQTA